MTYKAIPFRANISSGGTGGEAANQVQNLINQTVNEGWEFVSCSNIDTTIAGSSGCFGIGATPSTNTSVLVLIFKK